MAKVDLSREEAEGGYLPAVCMRCGAPAVCVRLRQFNKNGRIQSWLLAPLCGAHRWHWAWRSAVLRLFAIGFNFGICLGLFTLLKDHLQLAMVLVLAGFGVLAALAILFHYTSIRAGGFAETTLTITGVGEEFAAALREHRLSTKAGVALALPGSARRRPIRFTVAELEAPLPAMCIRCGEPPAVWKELSLDAAPGAWAILLFAFRLAAAAGGHHLHTADGEPLALRAAFCRRHRYHWLWRHYLVPCALPVAFLLMGLAAWADGLPIVTAVAGVTGMTAFICWLPLALAAHGTGVRRAAITKHTRTLTKSEPGGLIQSMEVTEPAVTLVGVSHRFCAAMEEQRRAGPAG